MKALVGRGNVTTTREDSTAAYWYRQAVALRDQVRILQAELERLQIENARLRQLAETPFDD